MAPVSTLARRGVLDVLVTLRDYAIVTYAVEPDALARQLAPGFTPQMFVLADGRQCALVSAVVFTDVDFRWRALGWPRFRFGQTNYRAYVQYGGRDVVWFLGTTLATRFVAIPRLLWQMPWHRVRMQFDCRWDGERCESFGMTARGPWGAAELTARGSTVGIGVLEGVASIEQAQRLLTHPTEGYFRRTRDGTIATYTIDHAPLVLQRATEVHARFDVFERLGLVAPSAVPHSVLLQRSTDYAIHLPPRRLS
ncbi:MAG: DUF2071 domain-containing protein [Nannocystaceae bacterium]